MVLLLQKAGDSGEVTLKIPANPRTWLPGKPIIVEADLQLPDDLAPGEYKLYLSLPDPEPTLNDRPDYAIQLANPGLWDATTGRHDLNAALTIK